MELNQFEQALVAALIDDAETPDPISPLRIDALEVETRAETGSGFVTELRNTDAAKLFAADVTLRWGAKVVACINSQERVGMVVYVDHGRLAALEGYTFGGRPWPKEIRTFQLERIESSG